MYHFLCMCVCVLFFLKIILLRPNTVCTPLIFVHLILVKYKGRTKQKWKKERTYDKNWWLKFEWKNLKQITLTPVFSVHRVKILSSFCLNAPHTVFFFSVRGMILTPFFLVENVMRQVILKYYMISIFGCCCCLATLWIENLNNGNAVNWMNFVFSFSCICFLCLFAKYGLTKCLLLVNLSLFNEIGAHFYLYHSKFNKIN